MNWLTNALAGVVGAAVLVGGAWGLGVFSNDVTVDQNGTVTTVTGPAGKDGAKGATGAAGKDGAVGAVGPIGPAGAVGPKGADATVNLTTLAQAVKDEIARQANILSVTFTGTAGNNVRTLDVTTAGAYDIIINNYASGDFEVSIENASNVVTTLVDTTGHTSTTVTKTLTVGTWKVYVSSTGSWQVKVVQQ